MTGWFMKVIHRQFEEVQDCPFMHKQLETTVTNCHDPDRLDSYCYKDLLLAEACFEHE